MGIPVSFFIGGLFLRHMSKILEEKWDKTCTLALLGFTIVSFYGWGIILGLLIFFWAYCPKNRSFKKLPIANKVIAFVKKMSKIITVPTVFLFEIIHSISSFLFAPKQFK